MSDLREMSWTDIPELVRLEAEAFPDDAWTESSWWGELAGRPRRDYVALERDGELAAYGGIDHGGQVADLMTVAVAPRHRGSGLGEGLLDYDAMRAAVDPAGRGITQVIEHWLPWQGDSATTIRTEDQWNLHNLSYLRSANA